MQGALAFQFFTGEKMRQDETVLLDLKNRISLGRRGKMNLRRDSSSVLRDNLYTTGLTVKLLER